ncbi:hypothetical protein D6817_00565 [Candidatus Pacearchaeota archaeon]|nr:MAG: hypothetical protein D6817_00565 [Candidatus Pacearchaeota archaeon]
MAKKSVKKGAKKVFYEVHAPLTSERVELLSDDPEKLVGRKVLLDLTKSLRGKNLELRLLVQKEGEKLVGVPVEVRLVQGYVKKAVRKGTDYSEDSFVCECRDKRVRIKPLLVTRSRVSRAVLRALRNKAREFLTGYVKTKTAEELVKEIIANRLQRQMLPKLKKIYPLSVCEVRVFKVVGEKSGG